MPEPIVSTISRARTMCEKAGLDPQKVIDAFDEVYPPKSEDDGDA